MKPLENEKLLCCNNAKCDNGKYFHLSCLNYKRPPNNSKTTWVCHWCKASMMQETSSNSKQKIGQKQQCDNQLEVAAEAERLLKESSDDFVEFLDVNFLESEKFAPLANLTDKEFDLIKSDMGWLDVTQLFIKPKYASDNKTQTSKDFSEQLLDL